MKVLVTGGAGFIGSNLCEYLLAHNYGKWTNECRNMIRIKKDKWHGILKDGVCIGQIYLARAESRKLRYWAISCVSGIGFNTFNEARSYAKNFL